MTNLNVEYIGIETGIIPSSIIAMIEDGILTGEFNKQTRQWNVESNEEIVFSLVALKKWIRKGMVVDERLHKHIRNMFMESLRGDN